MAVVVVSPVLQFKGHSEGLKWPWRKIAAKPIFMSSMVPPDRTEWGSVPSATRVTLYPELHARTSSYSIKAAEFLSVPRLDRRNPETCCDSCSQRTAYPRQCPIIAASLEPSDQILLLTAPWHSRANLTCHVRDSMSSTISGSPPQRCYSSGLQQQPEANDKHLKPQKQVLLSSCGFDVDEERPCRLNTGYARSVHPFIHPSIHACMHSFSQPARQAGRQANQQAFRQSAVSQSVSVCLPG